MAWGHASKGHLIKLINIQNRVIKIIYPNSLRSLNTTLDEMYLHCNVLPLIKLFKSRYIIKYYFSLSYKNIESHDVNTRLQLNPPLKIPININKYGLRKLEIFIP